MGMIRIGLWEGLVKGDMTSLIHLAIFQYHTTLIFWSHFKCMTSEPGVLPKSYGTLSFSKIAPEMIRTMLGVKKHITAIEQSGDVIK